MVCDVLTAVSTDEPVSDRSRRREPVRVIHTFNVDWKALAVGEGERLFTVDDFMLTASAPTALWSASIRAPPVSVSSSFSKNTLPARYRVRLLTVEERRGEVSRAGHRERIG